jgi:gluconate 5-dehydrogenase
MEQSLLSMFDLTRRAAIVTGGSRGLGVSFARGLVKAGCDVALVARVLAAAEKSAQTRSAVAVT